ncbi:MAG: hypothetical protein NT003_02910 [Candidatus Magasanikbacteria bacterium]|nr:hypothetical protein [Candidatus Magasanikbacteria bacterium]
MSQTLYRHVLRDAWSVTWRHPALWIFGAFALFMGQSQFFYSLGGLFHITSLGTTAAYAAAYGQQWYVPLISPNSWVQVVVGALLAALCVGFIGFFTFMVIQSQGAIMAAGDYIFRKRLYSFKASWHAAIEHFWSLTCVLFLKFLATIVIAFGLYGIQDAVTRLPDVWWPKVLFVGGFVVFALLDIFITYISLFATCFIVLEKQGFKSAIKHGTTLFIRHWLASIEIGVIFLIANVIMGIVAKLVFAILFVPLFYFAVLMKVSTGLTEPIAALNIGILFAAVWFVVSIYTTWFYMSVVILFDHMRGDSPDSKIMRFFGSIGSRDI